MTPRASGSVVLKVLSSAGHKENSLNLNLFQVTGTLFLNTVQGKSLNAT